MAKITPCLWFDGNAEEAANFYVTLLPDSRVDACRAHRRTTRAHRRERSSWWTSRSPGSSSRGVNGGPQFPFTEAISFVIDCEDQAEVDRLWTRPDRGRRSAGPVRLAEGPLRRLVADHPAPARRDPGRSGPGAGRPRHGGDAPDDQDRRRRPASGVPGRNRPLRLAVRCARCPDPRAISGGRGLRRNRTPRAATLGRCGFGGQRVTLRPPTRRDAEILAAILAEPSVGRWWPGYDLDRVLGESDRRTRRRGAAGNRGRRQGRRLPPGRGGVCTGLPPCEHLPSSSPPSHRAGDSDRTPSARSRLSSSTGADITA